MIHPMMGISQGGNITRLNTDWNGKHMKCPASNKNLGEKMLFAPSCLGVIVVSWQSAGSLGLQVCKPRRQQMKAQGCHGQGCTGLCRVSGKAP